MKKFEVLQSQVLVDESFYFLEKQQVRLPRGQETHWYVNGRPGCGAVIIVPQTKTGDILLQKNYKHGANQVVVEFCAGLIDAGESPQQSAIRELQEELGAQAATWKSLGQAWANPTSSRMQYHFWLAQGVEINSPTQWDDAEQIEPFPLPAAEVDAFFAKNLGLLATSTLASWHLARPYFFDKSK